MSMMEWWWLYDVKRAHDPEVDYAGTLTEETVKELYKMLEDE